MRNESESLPDNLSQFLSAFVLVGVSLRDLLRGKAIYLNKSIENDKASGIVGGKVEAAEKFINQFTVLCLIKHFSSSKQTAQKEFPASTPHTTQPLLLWNCKFEWKFSLMEREEWKNIFAFRLFTRKLFGERKAESQFWGIHCGVNGVLTLACDIKNGISAYACTQTSRTALTRFPN